MDGWVVGWFVGWFVCWLVGWLVGCWSGDHGAKYNILHDIYNIKKLSWWSICDGTDRCVGEGDEEVHHLGSPQDLCPELKALQRNPDFELTRGLTVTIAEQLKI